MVLKLLRLIILFCGLSSHAEELKIITPESFVNENPSLERKAIVDFLVNQFDGNKISQAELDELWKNDELNEENRMIRFQIINQKLYAASSDVEFTHSYFRSYFIFFKNLVQKYQINDVDFIIYDRDQVYFNNNYKAPTTRVFIGSKDILSPYEKDKFLLPDAMILEDYWGNLLQKIATANQQNKWSNKIDKIFWRGATSGPTFGDYDLANFDKLPRLSLVMFSKLYPDLIDAKFTRYNAFARKNSITNILKILDAEPISVSEVDHLKYKYLISVDGSTCAWLRVPWIMYSNSLLVKQETPKMQWFYSALKPYVHYVPVNEKLTDIFSQLDWMKNHDEELKKISENAHNFVSNNLMPEHLEAQMVIVLNEYSKIQKDEKIKASLHPADEPWPLSYLIPLLIKKMKQRLIGASYEF